MKKTLLGVRNVIVSFAALILVWQLVFIVGQFNEALFPAPTTAFKALVETIRR